MGYASAQFNPSGTRAGDELNISVAWIENTRVLQSPPVRWQISKDPRASIEVRYIGALRDSAGATALRAQIDELLVPPYWDGTVSRALLTHGRDGLRMTMATEACRLLPELLPVPDVPGDWLDRKLPIVRTLPTGTRRPAGHSSPHSVAILYQDTADGVFEEQARAMREELLDAELELDLDLFPGSSLVGEGRWTEQANKVFIDRRIVVFLGHLRLPKAGDEGGWMMTDSESEALEIDRIVRHLRDPNRKANSRGARLPELVISACCRGAWGAGDGGDPIKFFYPEKFLAAGVRHFVGPWMDVHFPELAEGTWQSIRQLITALAKGWHADPESAPRALFEAKATCGNPWLASLFQLYEGDEGVDAPVPAATKKPSDKPPPRPQLADLAPGDRIGAYTVERALFRDNRSSCFAAHGPDGRACLLQLPSDALQAAPDLPARLEAARNDLVDAGLSRTGHLLHDRLLCDLVARAAAATEPTGDIELVALVHDFDPDAGWQLLADIARGPDAQGHFGRVLDIGAAVAARLAEMHLAGREHGGLTANAVLVHETDDTCDAMLKDAWIARATSGRTADARYAAPDAEATEPALTSRRDVWALGVLLFEFATGRAHTPGEASVRAAVAPLDPLIVPEALERMVRECLKPAAALRPSAFEVARRLKLASLFGGTYLSDLAEEFRIQILSGQRLFAVRVDAQEELQTVLLALRGSEAQPRCRIYVADEATGVRELPRGELRLTWPEEPFPSPEEAERRARELFGWIEGRPVAGAGDLGNILIIRGWHWWATVRAEAVAGFLRRFARLQQLRGPLSVVIADDVRLPPIDPGRAFARLNFPQPTPAELFERIVKAGASGPELAEEVAARLADRLYPCSARELRECLAICRVDQGRIDESAADIRDHLRALRVGGVGTLAYTPAHGLPDEIHFGWPPAEVEELETWTRAVMAGEPAPRRLLVTGGPGFGKTTAARTLARRLRRPLFTLDARACLRSGLGASEALLAASLNHVAAISHGVLLLDGIDQLVAAGQAALTEPTLVRMASVLSQWLDRTPESLVIIATQRSGTTLPASWLRRLPRLLALGDLNPNTLAVDVVDGLEYRCNVIAALWRRFLLPELAADAELVRDVATQTCPNTGPRLPSPAARRARRDAALGTSEAGALSGQSVKLDSGADIEAWMAETLLLHASYREVDKDFWRDAVSPDAPATFTAP